MFEIIRFVLCALLLIGGILITAIGIFGVFRFSYALNRIHASGMLDSLGLLLIILGCAVGASDGAISIKLLAAMLFQWITSPVSGHLIANLIYETDAAFSQEVSVWNG